MPAVALRSITISVLHSRCSFRGPLCADFSPFSGFLCAVVLSAQTRTTLDIYLVDVEGGNATLFVAPSGESLLIDTGNGGAAATRDGDRIMAAVKDAGLSQIDHLVTTHYHGDHYGAMENVAGRIPIRDFIDHGPNAQPNQATDDFLEQGLSDPLCEVQAHCRQAGRPNCHERTRHPRRRISGAGAYEFIAGRRSTESLLRGAQPKDADPTENAQSVGTHFTFGRFKTVHLGDLTWNKEYDLVCPNNRLGTVDLFIVTHHGQPVSNAPALVHAIAPRVAIMNNGTRKGGQPDAMTVLFSSPKLEDLWQIHFSLLSGQGPRCPGCSSPTASTNSRPHCPSPPLPPRSGSRRGAAARPQRDRLLDQGLRQGGWVVHRDQRTERIQQDLRALKLKFKGRNFSRT